MDISRERERERKRELEIEFYMQSVIKVYIQLQILDTCKNTKIVNIL